jgi:UDP-glucuronate 4-epimerase
MKVLLTGVAGFIGSHVAERLLADGWDVVGLDSFDDFYDPAIKHANLESLHSRASFQLVEADIRDRRALDAIAGEGQLDGIVHLAARAGVRPSLEKPRDYVDTNLAGTTELLELTQRSGIPRFVFGSSSSVYGEREGSPFTEDDNVDFPVSPYAATKKAGELLCYTYNHNFALAVSCLRFFTVYGPRQRPEMAIHKFTRLIEEGKPVTLYGNGKSRRDYTFVADIVDGVTRALERADGYKVYNLGNNRTVELNELIQLLEKNIGKKAKIEYLPPQPGDVPLTCANIERARQELGYNPTVPIELGLERFVEWFKKKKK